MEKTDVENLRSAISKALDVLCAVDATPQELLRARKVIEAATELWILKLSIQQNKEEGN